MSNNGSSKRKRVLRECDQCQKPCRVHQEDDDNDFYPHLCDTCLDYSKCVQCKDPTKDIILCDCCQLKGAKCEACIGYKVGNASWYCSDICRANHRQRMLAVLESLTHDAQDIHNEIYALQDKKRELLLAWYNVMTDRISRMTDWTTDGMFRPFVDLAKLTTTTNDSVAVVDKQIEDLETQLDVINKKTKWISSKKF